MKRTIILMALVLMLNISMAYAALAKPTIVSVTPVSGETISGDYTFQVKLEYPAEGDRAEVKQVMFRYIVKDNCTQQCKVTIGNDLSEAFGWKVEWDTTTVPDGTYDLQAYAFAEGGNLLLAQQMINNVTVDQSYIAPKKEEPAAEQPEENVTEVPPAEEPEEEAPAFEENKTTAPVEKPKAGFWARFFAWLKNLFT